MYGKAVSPLSDRYIPVSLANMAIGGSRDYEPQRAYVMSALHKQLSSANQNLLFEAHAQIEDPDSSLDMVDSVQGDKKVGQG